MCPVYHQTTQRVETHLWPTLLAYHLVHHLRLRLKAQVDHEPDHLARGEVITRGFVRSFVGTADQILEHPAHGDVSTRSGSGRCCRGHP